MRSNVPQYNLNPNVSGGSERSIIIYRYRTESRSDDEDFDYSRNNFQVNLESKVTERFTVGTQSSARLETT